MSSIEVYSPRECDLHLTLPHDHANSLFTTSPFTYKLDEELDFVEVFPPGLPHSSLMALDPMLVSALFWSIHRTKQIINRATRGVVATVAVNAPIPDELFENLGMKKPRLVALLERTDINPLRCFGDKTILAQIVRGLQQLGREAIDWMVEARWRSRLMGNLSLWNWEDPRVLRPLSRLSNSRLVGFASYPDSPATSSSDGSLRSTSSSPFIPTPNYSPIVATLPFEDTSSRPSSPTDSIIPIPPNSPTSVLLPLVEIGEGTTADGGDDVELMLQLVLHPTASRYAQRYPLVDVFAGNPLANNGYVETVDDCAMDVDQE